jgi:hypothetical protein
MYIDMRTTATDLIEQLGSWQWLACRYRLVVVERSRFRLVKTDPKNFATLQMGEELSSDHPGANDPEYRKRRYTITLNAKTFRQYVWHLLGKAAISVSRTASATVV